MFCSLNKDKNKETKQYSLQTTKKNNKFSWKLKLARNPENSFT